MHSSYTSYGVFLIMVCSLGNCIGMFPYWREMNYAFTLTILSVCGALLVGKCKEYRISVLDITVSAFILYMLVRLLASEKMYMDSADICKWMTVIGVYLMVRSMTNKIALFYFIIFTGVIETITAVLQYIGIIESQHSYFQVTGHLGNPGPLGGYLAVCWVIALHLCYTAHVMRKRQETFCLVGVTVLLAVGMFLSDSRAAWLGALVSLVTFFPYLKCKKRIAIMGFLICVVIIGGLLYMYRPVSADARLLVWRVTWNMILDSPIFGHGIGSFPHRYMLYQADYFFGVHNPNEMIIADNVGCAFNEWLHLSAETGFIGLILLVPVIYVLVRYGKNEMILGGLLVWGIFASFSYPVEIFPFLLLLPVLLGGLETPILYRKEINGCVQYFVILCFVFVACYSYKGVNCYQNVGKNWTSFSCGRDTSIIHQILVDYPELKANVTYNLTFLQQMMHRSTDASQMDMFKQIIPNSETYVELGKYYKRIEEYPKAEEAFIKASCMVPNRLKPTYNLWRLYMEKGDTAKAVAMANHILSQPIKVVNSFTINVQNEVTEFRESIINQL